MAEFAAALATRLRSHQQFWTDLALLRSAGVAGSLHAPIKSNGASKKANGAAFDRLLYSASVFAEAGTEYERGLAQTIALSVVLTSHEEQYRQRSASILAAIGNFPNVRFLQTKYGDSQSSFLDALRTRLLATINTVRIGSDDRALTDFQLQVWNDLPTSLTTAISAPTSAGKSFLVIEYLCQRVLAADTFTAIFIAPTRALLAEVHRRISDRLPLSTGVRVSSVPSIDPEGRVKQVYVLTQERLYVLLSALAPDVDLVVVDEAQGLGDSSRGMILQDCIERVRSRSPSAQVLFLAPGAEGFGEVAKLLGIQEIDIKETNLSPVLQHRILVQAKPGDAHGLHLSLLSDRGVDEIGRVSTKRGILNPETRLAAAALELGGDGSALVYAPGPSDAETTAGQLVADIPISELDVLEELGKFIRSHIHPEYELAAMVRHGVAFHYGKMPRLLRESLERVFRAGDLRFLVCTTTLFQGVNLPARSVFIDTPTRGRGVVLDPALLWNFAGRAGRLGQEIVGNVFLVDYNDWGSRPLDFPTKYKLSPAFAATLVGNFDAVLEAVKGNMPTPSRQDESPARIRAAAGLLLAQAARDSGSLVLDRVSGLSDAQREQLRNQAAQSLRTLNVPARIIETNWTVDAFGLARLQKRMIEKVSKGEVDDLIPVHPRDKQAFIRYTQIFSRIIRDILGRNAGNSGAFIATHALDWMRGVPYPVLISKWIRHQRKTRPNTPVRSLVREAFEFIEDVLRFQQVQLAKAYLDLLHHVFEQCDLRNKRAEIFDYGLALELGVSTTSGRAFVELGISRIGAQVLEALFPDSELTPSLAREKLSTLDVDAVQLSPMIVRELQDLKLIPGEPNLLL